MAYAATIINRRDHPGGSTEVDVLLHDATGVRPDVRESRIHPTPQVNSAFLTADAAAVVARIVANQNREVLLRQRADGGQGAVQTSPALPALAQTFMDAVAIRIANGIATPATQPWQNAHDAALRVLLGNLPGLMGQAISEASEAAG